MKIGPQVKIIKSTGNIEKYSVKTNSKYSVASNGLYRINTVFEIRPYQRDDFLCILNLLSFIECIYPGGQEWLMRRLGDVTDNKAKCTVVASESRPIAVSIETPKGSKKMKLSTLYVHPAFRGFGIGSHLLNACKIKWIEDDMDYVYVTIAASNINLVAPVFLKHGFLQKTIELSRYGELRDEIIYQLVL